MRATASRAAAVTDLRPAPRAAAPAARTAAPAARPGPPPGGPSRRLLRLLAAAAVVTASGCAGADRPQPVSVGTEARPAPAPGPTAAPPSRRARGPAPVRPTTVTPTATPTTPVAASVAASPSGPADARSTVVPAPPAPPAPPPTASGPPSRVQLLAGAYAGGFHSYAPAVSVDGRVVAWLARVPAASGSGQAITLLRMSPALRLTLHGGTADPGRTSGEHGPAVAADQLPGVVAGFNGGFKTSENRGGFAVDGVVLAPLRAGYASVVSYADGGTDIGSWQREVPAAGRRVVSVRQNLQLLIDHGAVAGTVDCGQPCWGYTLHGAPAVARSGLAVDSSGDLVYAGGEGLTVRDLASALSAAGAVRALELDINPEWVAAYLFAHGSASGPVQPVGQVTGQTGIPGALLSPDSRDFFAVSAF